MTLTLRNVVNRALAFYEFDDNLQFVETKALEAQAARDAAVMFSKVFDSTALGIAGTTSGQYFTVPGTGGVYLYLYKNVAGVATLSATLNAFVGGTLTGSLNEAPPVTIASAASIDIGAAASNTVIISGTATITSLGTIAAGAIRYLRATGAFTLTHNATSLILPGGVNIVAAVGDVFRMESLGAGNWRMTGKPFVGGTLTGSLNEAPPVTIASAASIDIGAAASNTVIISGTAAITSLGTIAAGAIRYLRATGAFTLTHNATSLILPGGVNIVAAVGDVFRMESLGAGNWRMTGFQSGSTHAYQPLDATLTSLSALGTAADKLAYTTAADTWAETPLTAAGRALIDDASAAAQLATLGTEALKTFVSADQTITLGGGLTLPHGLGSAPRDLQVMVVCQTAELGYSIGDVVTLSSSTNYPAMWPDAANVNVKYSSGTPGVVNRTTGNTTTITTANWKARFFAIK